MARLYANNYSTLINGAITNSTTSILVDSVAGLPSLTGGDYIIMTLDTGTGVVEIIKVTAIASLTLTVVRGQQGTSAVAWADNSVIEVRATKASYEELQPILSGSAISAVTIATNDKVLIQDTSDSNNLRTVTAQDIANLAPSSTPSNSFPNIAVSGQTTITAASATDTLNIAAGSNVTITTNNSTKTVTITASGGGGGGGQTPWTSNIDTAGYTLTNSSTPDPVKISGSNGVQITASNLHFYPNNNFGAQLYMHEGASSGTDYVRLKAPNDVVTSYTITLPDNAPAGNNYMMSFDTSGNATFVAPGIPDADYGDITVSGGVWTIDNQAVSLAKIAGISNNRILGRVGTFGSPQELTDTQVKTIIALNNVENTALSTWTGSAAITTLGTIATGTWNGTNISVSKGGTGATTNTGNGSNVLSNSPILVTPALGTPSSAVLTNATGLPLTTGVSGTLSVANGGTGGSSLTAYGVLTGGTTSTGAVQSVAVGSTGQVLTSNGSGASPSFQSIALPAYIGAIVQRGGTNQAAIPAATPTKVLYNTSVRNSGLFDIITNFRFTATTAGVYQINTSVKLLAVPASALCITFAYVNGSLYQELARLTNVTTGANATVAGSTQINLASSDYVEIFVTCTSSVALDGTSSGTFFSASFMGV